jgi:signal recognition particle subunit SRP54
MFETLTARLNQAFDRLRRRGKLSEADVDEALREIRLALLEADVNFAVAKTLLGRVRERAIGAEVSRALNPGQQVVKIVREELVSTLGAPVPLNLAGPRPRTVMLVGLQGSGKTTAAAKLARRLKSSGERVLLVAADPYRPAAVEQLQQLAQQIDVPVEHAAGEEPPALARRAHDRAGKGGMGVVILDTAGRSQLDEALMKELRSVAAAVQPAETLLVLDAMTGQESVHIAEGFKDVVPVTGLILSKMDGDARGGAAISIREVAGIPVKFIGTGEKLDALEEFDPARVADRILGMGDVVGLIEKAESVLSQSDARVEAKRIFEAELNLEDWLRQMKQVRKLGSMSQIMEMLPGQLGRAARQASPQALDQGFKEAQSIIQSMTTHERRDPGILNASRRRRIAAGSGNDVQAVNRLLKQFREAQKLMKMLGRSGGVDFRKLLG